MSVTVTPCCYLPIRKIFGHRIYRYIDKAAVFGGKVGTISSCHLAILDMVAACAIGY